MDEEYEQDEYEQGEPVAAAPVMPRQWSWSTETLLWVAGGVVATGFVVWALVSYTGAKTRALTAGSGDDGTE